jgi:CcmD family protein
MFKPFFRKLIMLPLLLMTAWNGFAQNSDEYKPVDMADTMRSNGKIYVVVVVLVIILLGLLLYLFSIDRRLKRLEKKDR